MAKVKDISFVPAKELEAEINERESSKKGLALSRQEHQKVQSGSHSMGKKVERKERKTK